MVQDILPSIDYIDLRIRNRVPPLQTCMIGEPWMVIMLSGKLEYLLNHEPITATEGNVLCFQSVDFVGRQEQNTDVRYLSIRFRTNGAALALDHSFPVIGERQRLLIGLLQDYYFGNELGMQENRAAAEHIFHLLLCEFEQNCINQPGNKRITAIRNYILQHFGEGIGPADVAAAFYLNPSYLNTMYKKQTGEQISAFLDRVRLDHACRKLLYSQAKIADIAAECGFQDTFYFSRWFSKKEGSSPREYRKKR